LSRFDLALRVHLRARRLRNVRKSRGKRPPEYQERISELEKQLRAAVEEHRRMRRELETLEERDPYEVLLRGIRAFPHIDDETRN
jgi:signal transduction histidine kinase